ncbi:hypothetical protein [Yersinia frederiksenii]|uniref:hypothetical protein n=1 Tax=Yersinia frederiksenii TaxID=29484 RepID=UPI00005F909E|nr:hypothetical protein [Yersinia frederiksenii]EEQ13850.1 hypothetical protein yfred0001_39540 [Yersinia frederiksenii ATCC 33641]
MLFGIEKGQLDTFLNKHHMKLLGEMDANILEKRFFYSFTRKGAGQTEYRAGYRPRY